MDERLRFEHVTISYDRKTAVNDVSFTLHDGEILGIVGESGSGKSTLVRSVIGLLGPGGRVVTGDIIYEGRNLAAMREKDLRQIRGNKIGMIFQNAGASFCPVRRIGSQLFESVSAHEKTDYNKFKVRAEELLHMLGFEDPGRTLDSYPFELSGGMQQRVGIAAAMLLSPDILLADEPTSALDAHVQKQVVQELLNIRRRFGTSIIMVTHNIAVVEAMADSVLVMKDGIGVEYGDAGAVLKVPENEYTRKLLAAVPRLEGEI